jgi:hypothetical protein
MVHGVYGNIHADSLYHPCQFETDISTMIDKGDYFVDYFPLKG